MSNVDKRLRTVFAVAVTWIVLISAVMVYLHFSAQHRQAQRELIYIKAVEQAAQERRNQERDFEKRRREDQRRREYNQGKVAGHISL